MKKISTIAPAKINLGLEVLYKRADGFHEINTIFTKINLFDEILIEENDGFELIMLPDYNLDPKDNLVTKAVKALQNEKYFKSDLRILLHKNIPIGGGLGGGSSDAASILMSVNNFFDLKIPNPKLMEIGLTLGSDVPFFLNSGSAQAAGRGEILSYFDYTVPYKILVVNPNIHVSTKWAYYSLGAGIEKKLPFNFKNVILESKENPSILKEKIFNDFEETVFKEFPDIKKIKEIMYDSGAVFSLMSGSGASVFGFFENMRQVETTAAKFPKFKCYLTDALIV